MHSHVLGDYQLNLRGYLGSLGDIKDLKSPRAAILQRG